MTKRRRRATARAVLSSWVLLGIAASPATAGPDPHSAHGASATPIGTLATVTTPGAECPAQISCGVGCVATYAAGFCTVTFTYEARFGVGGLQIGPSFKVECGYCDCWYLAPGPNGLLLKRHYALSCGASFPGLEYE